MQYTLLLLPLLLVVAHCKIVTLNNQNFEETINSNKYTLVAFYAPWCKYSKALYPDYKELATTFEDSKVTIAKIDCDQNDDLADKFDIQGFPTIKLFKKGLLEDPVEYTGETSADDIAKWVNKATGNSGEVKDKKKKRSEDAPAKKRSTDDTPAKKRAVGETSTKKRSADDSSSAQKRCSKNKKK